MARRCHFLVLTVGDCHMIGTQGCSAIRRLHAAKKVQSWRGGNRQHTVNGVSTSDAWAMGFQNPKESIFSIDIRVSMDICPESGIQQPTCRAVGCRGVWRGWEFIINVTTGGDKRYSEVACVPGTRIEVPMAASLEIGNLQLQDLARLRIVDHCVRPSSPNAPPQRPPIAMNVSRGTPRSSLSWIK